MADRNGIDVIHFRGVVLCRFTKELTDVYLPPERHTVDPEELHYAELKAELKKNKQKMRAMMTSIEQLKDIMLETKANQPDTTEVRF